MLMSCLTACRPRPQVRAAIFRGRAVAAPSPGLSDARGEPGDRLLAWLRG